jgi:hypothetical protein
MTPAGVETATFRFVEQHLNHCATAVYILLQVPAILTAASLKLLSADNFMRDMFRPAHFCVDLAMSSLKEH